MFVKLPRFKIIGKKFCSMGQLELGVA